MEAAGREKIDLGAEEQEQEKKKEKKKEKGKKRRKEKDRVPTSQTQAFFDHHNRTHSTTLGL
jgi:hypothetical protein